jgi:hypothetical protein
VKRSVTRGGRQPRDAHSENATEAPIANRVRVFLPSPPPSPRWGEGGWLLYFSAALAQDGSQDEVDVTVNVVIQETDDAKALLFERSCSLFIVCFAPVACRAIDLDDQLRLVTEKVRNVFLQEPVVETSGRQADDSSIVAKACARPGRTRRALHERG